MTLVLRNMRRKKYGWSIEAPRLQHTLTSCPCSTLLFEQRDGTNRITWIRHLDIVLGFVGSLRNVHVYLPPLLHQRENPLFVDQDILGQLRHLV